MVRIAMWLCRQPHTFLGSLTAVSPATAPSLVFGGTASVFRHRRRVRESLYFAAVFSSHPVAVGYMTAVDQSIRRAIGSFLVCCCMLAPSQFALGQSGTRSNPPTGSSTRSSQQLLAEPTPRAPNPFLPAIDRDLRLPVAIKGFCVVTLRDHQQWSDGSQPFQQIFDGQLYWFVGQRERAIFQSNPRRYAPALSGDCVVTFAQDGERVPGDPQYGILHKRRLYFFKSHAYQELFRANPDEYADVDLAAEGKCLVSRIDQQRELDGLVDTTVIVRGLRYQFAGAHQQRTFLNNMVRYGVEPPQAFRVDGGSGSRFANAANLMLPEHSDDNGTLLKQEAPQRSLPAKIKNKAMAGYSPVSIRDKADWVEGDPQFRVEFDGHTYLMVDEEELVRFKENPDQYIPALAGHCVVTEVDENRRVKGTIYHASMHEGEDRLFLFAGAGQKELFDADPERYVNADLASDGLCIVTVLQDRKEVPGLPEFMTWHDSKRYFFASAEKQAEFLENVERYQE